jgi:radical SAM superfamily enzyme with C-terminal helix-hairpin-helix motif
LKVTIVDGYVDEPALFGVPPFISTYARYAWGVYASYGVEPVYLTIDQIRKSNLWEHLDENDHLVIIGGVSVPGKYVGGLPLSRNELEKIRLLCPDPLKIQYGAFTFLDNTALSEKEDKKYRDKYTKRKTVSEIECIVSGNLETYLFHLLKGDYPPENIQKEPDVTELAALHGAGVVSLHPCYPNVICEIELSSGCERKSHCSFCSEPLFHPLFHSRPVGHILKEVKALAEKGITHFRLGRTANIIAYGDNGKGPNPDAIEALYCGIREQVPSLCTLHTDNANPQYIQDYPDASTRILETIARYNTHGDILSFGVESFDPVVISHNNLGISVDSIYKAVQKVNEIGGQRKEGIPALLPGINLLSGLIGETKRTFQENLDALRYIYDQGWMLRRINLRQVLVFPNTPLWAYRKTHYLPFHKNEFKRFKENVRTQIDRAMLKRVFPPGTVIPEVIIEYREGAVSFGRPLWTYGILIGIEQPLDIGEKVDIAVSDYGFRSLTGVPVR